MHLLLKMRKSFWDCLGQRFSLSSQPGASYGQSKLKLLLVSATLIAEIIKQLSRDVHSSLRSGVILFDLTRVVEELIYNSLDAGALKIKIVISFETCSVKVDDDGCGITRDGLVLLGERYATSKLHYLAEMDTVTENFGFRGESICSLSDISVLEITTKAQGRPNGYRKIIKGCKCLYLGIDDTRQDFGTTVVARDLFYNQPVRRKCMNSSPKKVLDSVKKCVFRVTLMRPQVSFKVTDIESGGEVLFTHPSPSPLPLLSSGFGIDASLLLRELSFSKGVLKLSGFLSGPLDTLPAKAFQYVYINSRFVCKGPIHKLLNNMAASSNCLDLWNGSTDGKSRTQVHPAYILNLCCPRSTYDLMFEPSKTTVEFKDWIPILSFVEQAIRLVWTQTPSQGELHGQEGSISGKDKMWRKNENMLSLTPDVSRNPEFSKKKQRANHNLSFKPLNSPSISLEMATDMSTHLKKHRRPSEESWKSFKKVKGDQSKTGYDHQIDCTLQDRTPTSCDRYGFKNAVTVSAARPYLWSPTTESLSVQEDLFPSEMTASQSPESDVNNDIFGSRWRNKFLDVSNKVSTEALPTSSYVNYDNDVPFSPGIPKGLKKPLLHSCSLRGSSSCVKSFFKNDQQSGHGHGCKMQIGLDTDDVINVVEADDSDQHLNFSPKIYSLEKFLSSSPSSSILKKFHMMADGDILSSDLVKPHLVNELRFAEEDDDLLNNPHKEFSERSLDYLSTDFNWSSLSPYSVSRTAESKAELFMDEYTSKHNSLLHRSASSENFSDEGKDQYSHYNTMPNSSVEKDCPTSNCIDTEINCECHFSLKNDVYGHFQGSQSNDITTQRVRSSNKFALGKDWLCMDSSLADNMNSFGIQEIDSSSPFYHKDDKSADELNLLNQGHYRIYERRSKRSLSAPPFYRGKSRFSTLTMAVGDESSSPILSVTSGFKHSSESFGVFHHQTEPSSSKNSPLYPRTSKERMSPSMEIMTTIQKTKNSRKPHLLHPSEDFTSDDLEDLRLSGMKWRNGSPEITDTDKSHNLNEETDILDISSGLLHLAGGSLVPESISKDCLKDAKVLLQLDKKFIPVVAGVTLAVIDQHAADERIRLEELRQKVLSGEGKTVTFLDSEQELVLPEIEYQLLQNYSQQIQSWGWICNIDAHGSGSFRKNLNVLHIRRIAVFLLAVPCILGVNLSDKDLLEFLEQLAETDGSSTLPPSVVRILNSKACRGAIMFGDALVSSECSLIVEELKQTSLCFQCAHGRPTTVPLVNMVALHKQLSNLEMYKGSQDEPWHGLHRHKPSLERAKQRLASAGM